VFVLVCRLFRICAAIPYLMCNTAVLFATVSVRNTCAVSMHFAISDVRTRILSLARAHVFVCAFFVCRSPCLCLPLFVYPSLFRSFALLLSRALSLYHSRTLSQSFSQSFFLFLSLFRFPFLSLAHLISFPFFLLLLITFVCSHSHALINLHVYTYVFICA